MTSPSMEFAAEGILLAVAPFLAGLVLVAALIWAVWLGIRVRRREPRPPGPGEQPHLPEGGPVHEEREWLEPDELPPSSRPLSPYQVHSNSGGRRSADQRPRRWSRGSGGAFGSGGPGGSSN